MLAPFVTLTPVLHPARLAAAGHIPGMVGRDWLAKLICERTDALGGTAACSERLVSLMNSCFLDSWMHTHRHTHTPQRDSV